jgi:hypothetical protein
VSVANALTVISAMKTERGLALQDLITGAYEYIETIEFKPHARVYLLESIATAEYGPCSIFRYQTADLP